MDGSVVFARWRQCAPILYMLPSAHPRPQPKQHLDRFSRFCTAHDRESLYFTKGRPFHLKIAPLHWRSGHPSNIWFLRLTRVHNPNGISISSAVFALLTIVTDRQTNRQQTDHITPSVIPRLHDTTVCQSSCTTGLTTGCIA